MNVSQGLLFGFNMHCFQNIVPLRLNFNDVV